MWSAAALGTSRRAALVQVVLPAALPAILTGARIGLVGAIIGVFLGEMIAAADGLGHLMAISYRTLDTPGCTSRCWPYRSSGTCSIARSCSRAGGFCAWSDEFDGDG